MTRDIALLLRSAFCRAIEVVRWKPGNPWHVPEGARLSNSAVYGALSNCRPVAQNLGGRLVEPADSLMTELPLHWTRRAISRVTFEQARGVHHPAFWKPAEGKSFRSGIFASGGELPDMAPETPVLQQEIVEFDCEWRLFVKHGEVCTHSCYRGEGESLDALRFADRFLLSEQHRLPRAVVLDVGHISGDGWAVIEANPLACSSIYNCDPEIVLDLLPFGLVPDEISCSSHA